VKKTEEVAEAKVAVVKTVVDEATVKTAMDGATSKTVDQGATEAKATIELVGSGSGSSPAPAVGTKRAAAPGGSTPPSK
jgi:Tfp pilus assembly protein PilX